MQQQTHADSQCSVSDTPGALIEKFPIVEDSELTEMKADDERGGQTPWARSWIRF
jgi:hypothetical protein